MKKLFIYIVGAFCTACLINPPTLSAQQDSLAFQFHGSNVLDGQMANRQGFNSDVPQNLLRNDLQMTMTVANIPFATSFFITTEQIDYKQNINNLRFYIDLTTLRKNKARIEANNKAKNLANVKAPWALRFLSDFSKIEAGKYRPNYSELTLQGIAVSGVNIEYSNKIVYAAFASGTVKQQTENTETTEETYKQKLLFGKFGFGKKRTTHFYMTYMHIEDEGTQPLRDSTDYSPTLKAQSNVVVGAEFRLSFFENKWTIDGDAGVSAITRDTRIPVTYDSIIVDSILRKVPEFLVDAVQPNVSTSADYAYGFSTKLSLNTTTISGGYKWIGPGFFTLGNTMLVNDRQIYEGRIDQAFMKRRLSVSAFYKQSKDNLIDWKKGTTKSTSLGLIAKVTFKKAPYFQISYTPNFQETNGKEQSIRNNMNIFSFNTGYNYPVGSLKSNTNLSYFNQNGDYERDSSNQSNNTQTFSLNQLLDFKTPLKLNLNLSYSLINSTLMDTVSSERNVLAAGLSGSYTYKKWENTIGCKYLRSNSHNEKTVPDENKYSLFWDTAYNIWKELDIALGIDENIFRNGNKDDNYNETIVHCKLSFRW